MNSVIINSAKSAVMPGMLLKVDEKEYVLDLPLAAVAKAEEKLGRTLRTPGDWFCAPAKDIPALLEAAMVKHHPDVTPEEIASICDQLNPEAYGEIAEALGALAFPRFLARYKENMDKLRETGERPKDPSAAVL